MLWLSLQVGGVEEYDICEAIKSRRLFKPVIIWCIGTCAKMFTSEVQFGHAGACANAERETADAKNKVSTCCKGDKQPLSLLCSLLFRLFWRLEHTYLTVLTRLVPSLGRQTSCVTNSEHFWHYSTSLPGTCMSSWWLLGWLFLNQRRSPRRCQWTTLGPRSLVLSASQPPSCPVSVMRGGRSYCTLACLSQMYSRCCPLSYALCETEVVKELYCLYTVGCLYGQCWLVYQPHNSLLP